MEFPRLRYRRRPFFSREPSIVWDDWRPPRESVLRLTFVLCLTASFFDGWSTLRFMAETGGEEANAFMAAVIASGSWWLWWIKLACIPVLIYALKVRCRTHPFAWVTYISAAVLHVGLTIMHVALDIWVY